MDMSPATMQAFSDLLERRTGQQLTAGRRWRIETALKPLLRERDIDTLDRLAAEIFGCAPSPLSQAVVEALLNHETFFFREPAAFQQLDVAIEQIAQARAASRRLRIWCAACSTGQEAYSLAMSFAEAGAKWEGWTIEILGTDISAAAVARARDALYTQFEIQRGLPIRQMVRWFDGEGDQWRASAALRRAVRFEKHNLLDPAPCTAPVDVVLCRNVLLYFAAPVRRLVFDRLASAMAPDGVLMLGAGETVLGNTTRFVSDVSNRGLYRPAV